MNQRAVDGGTGAKVASPAAVVNKAEAPKATAAASNAAMVTPGEVGYAVQAHGVDGTWRIERVDLPSENSKAVKQR